MLRSLSTAVEAETATGGRAELPSAATALCRGGITPQSYREDRSLTILRSHNARQELPSHYWPAPAVAFARPIVFATPRRKEGSIAGTHSSSPPRYASAKSLAPVLRRGSHRRIWRAQTGPRPN